MGHSTWCMVAGSPPCVAYCSQETHWHLSSQVVAVAAMVHLLDSAAPAGVGAMQAIVHLLAQTTGMLHTMPCRSPSLLRPCHRHVK